MSDIADKLARGPTPLAIDGRLRARVTEAVLAQAAIRHKELNAFLRDRLGGLNVSRGALFAEPTIQGASGYISSGKRPADLAGSVLHPRLVSALTGEEGDDYRFNYPAHTHQLEAWTHLLAEERRSVLVSSGTGSGKTECFLIPMLDDLAREVDQTGRLTGVRALMLYPLNALIASQQERLRQWTAPFNGDIRFALYNGLMADKRKEQRDKAEEDCPEQVLHRQTLRDDPPPILVTNNTMLEYMTIRKEDHPIVEASQGLLRWIVIDEAHSYIGSAAAEVALLIRRVLQTFGVKAEQVRFVATSATIGGTDEKAQSDLRRYLADLAGVPEAQVHVVIGKSEKVVLPARGPQTILTPADMNGAAFSTNPAVQDFVKEIEAGPVSLTRANYFGSLAGLDGVTLAEAIARPKISTDGRSSAPLLPLRIHKFVRALSGLWSCLNPECTGDRPDGWPYGAIHFDRTETCSECSAPAFEIISCRECGEPWLNAFDHVDRLLPAVIAPDQDEFEAASAREMDEEDEGEADDEPNSPAKASEGQRRLIGVRTSPGLIKRTVDLKTGLLPENRSDGSPIDMSRSADGGACPRCQAAPSDQSSQILWPFRFGAPFLIQNATPTMLEGVARSERTNVELPAEGRQLLSFTDSRQGTARFAANIETMSERGYVRSLVYHMVQKAAAPPQHSVEEREELVKKRDKLAELAAQDSMFVSYLEEAEQELNGSGANASVPWSDAVRDLASEPMVRNWIGKVWDADRDDRFHRDPVALANYLLLRELARRPRRANAIETLGFAKLSFPQLEKIPASRLPIIFAKKGFALSDWRDFLYFLVDGVIRTNFVLNISWDDARWLLPRKSFLRHVVGPNQEKRIPSDVSWPKAPPSGAGSKSNAVLVLEQILELDCTSAEDRSFVDDILQSAWDQIRPLLEGSGSTLALSFDKASLAPVKNAWLCPVTHRVLPRLVFGRTPYGFRNSPLGGLNAPMPLNLPQLPVTFPNNDADRTKLQEYVANDPGIGNLREQGVWGNLHDRAATFAPYIRAEEHSAQQPPYRLRAFEDQFKRGEINLLACSTTMEMGVDIGSVEAVLNTNVPPSIANYRQRVGRAGRRGQSFSSSLTFARSTPLDREAFRDPVKYLNGTLRSPQVKIDSGRIVQRHVNALLLAKWFKQAEGQLARIKAGDFLGFPIDIKAEPEEFPPVARFQAWLREPSTAVAMSGPLGALTRGTALEGSVSLLSTADIMFGDVAESFGHGWAALRDQAKFIAPEAKVSIEIQIRRMCRESLLKELMVRSVLPGHGFPNSVVPFINDCADTRERQRNRQIDESETSRNQRYDYPSRNADVAIREYAPGAEIVVDGLVWTSAGVTLNWERPAHDSGAKEIQSIRWSWQCSDCGEAGCDRMMPEHCTACSSTSIIRGQFLEPAGFRVDWTAKPHADTDRVHFIEPQQARISARDATWEPLLDPSIGRGRFTGDGLVFHHSLGAEKQGYRICLDCGRAAEAGTGTLAEHDALMPPKGGAGRCAGNDKTYAITNPIALGHEVLTDVAEIQPASLTNLGAAWALASAFREALSRRLGIEPRELGLGVEKRTSQLGASTHSIFIYDQSAGGAGYSPRLFDDLVGTMMRAVVILDCPADCESGCSACVLVADLFAQQELIDRREALTFLRSMLTDMAEPHPDDVAGPDCTLSPPTADVLARRVTMGDTVSIWLSNDADIGALSQPPLSTLFAAAGHAGAKVNVIVQKHSFSALDDAVIAGLRNMSHKLGFVICTGTAGLASNGALLMATHQTSFKTVGFFTRDAGSTHIGPHWGVGAVHPVVEMPLLTCPPFVEVAADDLERKSKAGDRVRIIRADAGKPVRLFGTGFVNQVLKEDLAAAGLWKPSQLTSISYSDRYLKSPLPALLMLRVAAALRDALASDGANIPLTITTEPLRDDRYRGAPWKVGNNWPNEIDRSHTIEAMAARLRFECDYDDRHAAHGRKMVIQYDDGSAAILLFDQGFGYWRASSGDRHDFRASPQQQAKALLDASTFVSGVGESYIAITRI